MTASAVLVGPKFRFSVPPAPGATVDVPEKARSPLRTVRVVGVVAPVMFWALAWISEFISLLPAARVVPAAPMRRTLSSDGEAGMLLRYSAPVPVATFSGRRPLVAS